MTTQPSDIDPAPAQGQAPAPAPGPTPARSRGPAGLILKGAALLAAAFATVAAIVLLVPDDNDYAKATGLKHRLLAADQGPKVVLVGGSNLAFGVDSARIERATGCRVVNMGMNGYLGVRYMLAEIKPYLRPSDTVVVALEYDSYYKSVDGTPADQLALIRTRLQTFSYLTWPQRWAALGRVPYVAQQKVLRLTRDGARSLKGVLGQPEEKTGVDISDIEVLSGFNGNGDLVSHLNVPWTAKREDGVDQKATPVDPGVLDLLASFVTEMKAKDVNVVVSFTPVERGYYDRYHEQIDALYRAMTVGRGLPAPAPPESFVFPADMMFDTVYHLNAKGRPIRTDQLIGGLKKQLGERAQCSSQSEL